jgi:cell division protein FtsB
VLRLPARPPSNRRRARSRVPLAIVFCLLISGYFVQHAISGKHGLDARNRLTERAKRASADVKAREADLQSLQRDVALLSSDPPDADLVEEIAVDVLGFIPAGGLIVVRLPTAGVP